MLRNCWLFEIVVGLLGWTRQLAEQGLVFAVRKLLRDGGHSETARRLASVA